MAPEVVQLHLSTVTFPESHPLAGRRGEIFGYIVLAADGVMLFDSGVGTNNRIDELFRPENRDLASALRERGLSLSDISAVASSHLHVDHCGQNPRFPGVPIYVQRSEYEAARQPGYTVTEWVDFPGASYELLDGEAMVLEGVLVVPTPGHTPGHQSLKITAGGEISVVAGQAVYTAAEWDGSTASGESGAESAWDRSLYDQSVDDLRRLEPNRVFFGHDSTVWRRSANP